MARGQRLTDSVSVAGLLHMREVEGLSNGEIAAKLDVSTSTIYNLIGKHPDGKRKKRRAKNIPTPPPIFEEPAPHVPFAERCQRALGTPESHDLEVMELIEPENEAANDANEHIGELLLLFGADAVKSYLRCMVYKLSLAKKVALSREECLAELKRLEEE